MRIQDQLIYDIVDLITNLLKKNLHIYPATQRTNDSIQCSVCMTSSDVPAFIIAPQL